jgi:DNA-binding NtrC family response regulator
MIERIVLLEDDEVLKPQHLPSSVKGGGTHPSETTVLRMFEMALSRPLPKEGVPFEDLLQHAEKEFIIKAMKEAGGNQSKAARLLQLNRDKLRYRLKNFGLDTE